ncbi:MAG: hypothetical protein V1934_05300 [Methanobacteriota archaeon]
MSVRIYRMAALALVGLLALSLVPLGSVDAAAPAPPTTRQAAGATQVTVGIYVVGFGNFDANKGTYTIDFYMWLAWDASDANFSALSYEFMNGRASSTQKLSDVTSDGVREVWYRIQASLYNEPQFKTYPFNEFEIVIQIEDSKLTVDDLVYVADTDGTTIDESLNIPGWQMNDVAISVSDKVYENWGETYSRTTFSISIGRAVTTTAIKTLLPPIIFCIVSGLSFAFRPDKIANRIGFGTSMLISAVMFHISQTSSLPPMPMLMTIDKIMIATYGFLAASLFVTTVIYIDEEYWKEVDYSKQVNYYGAILAIALPFIIYGLLNL